MYEDEPQSTTTWSWSVTTQATTQTKTKTTDLLEDSRRILNGTTPDSDEPIASGCCSSEKQEVCCEPADKAECCGPATAKSGTGCGCR
jgi:hypothetical protein